MWRAVAPILARRLFGRLRRPPWLRPQRLPAVGSRPRAVREAHDGAGHGADDGAPRVRALLGRRARSRRPGRLSPGARPSRPRRAARRARCRADAYGLAARRCASSRSASGPGRCSPSPSRFPSGSSPRPPTPSSIRRWARGARRRARFPRTCAAAYVAGAHRCEPCARDLRGVSRRGHARPGTRPRGSRQRAPDRLSAAGAVEPARTARTLVLGAGRTARRLEDLGRRRSGACVDAGHFFPEEARNRGGAGALLRRVEAYRYQDRRRLG